MNTKNASEYFTTLQITAKSPDMNVDDSLTIEWRYMGRSSTWTPSTEEPQTVSEGTCEICTCRTPSAREHRSQKAGLNLMYMYMYM